MTRYDRLFEVKSTGRKVQIGPKIQTASSHQLVVDFPKTEAEGTLSATSVTNEGSSLPNEEIGRTT